MNKQFKKTTIFILILAMLFVFTACGDTTLAKIKDTEITQEQIDSYVSYYSLLSLSTSKSELGEDELAYLEGIIFNFAIEVQILKQHYADQGVTVLPEDFDDLFNEYRESLLSQSDDMQSQLSNEGITNDTLEFFFGAQYYTKKFMDDIDNETPVTDDEIEAYYKENKDSLVSPAQINVSHILIQDADHTDAGRTSIEAIKARIDDGESFEDMAKEYSNDGSAASGGALGWINQNTSYVQEFKDAAFALDKGEMSDVVETEYGYHLILVTDTEDEHQKTLKEATEEIKGILQEERYAAGIEALKEEIGVEFTDEGNKIIEGSGTETDNQTSDESDSGE